MSKEYYKKRIIDLRASIAQERERNAITKITLRVLRMRQVQQLRRLCVKEKSTLPLVTTPKSSITNGR